MNLTMWLVLLIATSSVNCSDISSANDSSVSAEETKISKDFCYSARKRSRVLEGLSLGGVPTIVTINFMVSVVLVGLFIYLRKLGWDYWRIALVKEVAESTRKIREKCGEDAVHYLSFQSNVLLLLLAVCVISVVVILPVNTFLGDFFEGNFYDFGQYTIANLDTNNKILWLHTSTAGLFVILTVYYMRRHTSNMHYKEDAQVKRTLFVTGIPKYADESDIARYFELTYENCEVVEARKCYDVAKLMELNSERKQAEVSKQYYLNLQARENVITTITPKGCGRLLGCISRKEEAVSYYTELEAKTKDAVRKERERVSRKPLGMAFVTLQNESIAASIMKDFNTFKCQRFNRTRRPKTCHLSAKLRTNHWKIDYAPDPQNIHWENLSVGGIYWWMRMQTVIFILLTIGFFLTTPFVAVNNVDKILYYYNYYFYNDGGKSAESLNFVTLFGEINFAFLFRCLFLPDSGAFFVNYVISSGFIGNAMSLLRIPGLLMYMIRICLARSAVERVNVKMVSVWTQAVEFPFGEAYAWMMCVVSVVMAYSISCPIIVIFG
ncbi:CSC1-like protein 2 [Aulostomus maculatus]